MRHEIDQRVVWVGGAPAPDYRRVDETFPELPGFEPTSAAVALRTLLFDAGLDHTNFGKPVWNPISAVCAEGLNVVVKPNWVSHQNASSAGWECLITHPSVLEVLCRYILKTRPRRLTIADAPVQGCDFAALMRDTGTGEALARLPAGATDVAIRDLRLVTMDELGGGITHASRTRDVSDYVTFDLAGDSLLEPITAGDTPFRVTMYDPRALEATHGPGRHRYLVARELIEADVVFNVPKLKTHKKAGITGALKNLVGINGHKSFLPHHRKGGAGRGGDAYPGHSPWKAWAETAYDAANRLAGGHVKAALFRSAAVLERAGAGDGEIGGVEGSWHGNDTVWRMSLDLQRLLRYGCTDGTLATSPRRAIVTVTDAVIAGQGEGPLAPSPCPMGLVTLSTSPAAAEWVHAALMRLDPRRIPIVAHAFDTFRYPIAGCAPDEIEVRYAGQTLTPEAAGRAVGVDVIPPAGWRGQCERLAEA